MNDEPRRRGRPPRVVQDMVETPIAEDILAAEAVVENPTVQLVEEELLIAEDIPIAGTVMEIKESPVEEKIHQLVEQANIPIVDGWENNMRIAPTDGRRIMVSATGEGQGSLVYWRISRIIDKKNLRYIPKGRWTDFLSKKDIDFTPSYWKPYNPEEYWPLTV